VLTAGCSSSSSGNPPATHTSSTSASTPAGGGAAITIKNFSFSGTLSVSPGEKITVTNQDSTAHTLTDGSVFNTGSIAPGGTATFTAPSAAGSYNFMCTIHPSMTATLKVS